MAVNRAESSGTANLSGRRRTASFESARQGDGDVSLAPIGCEGGRQTIGISNKTKRDFKDKRIYVNPRTGLAVRPPTSFGLFKHAMRRQMKDNKVGFQEFNRRSTEQWAKMNDQEKEPYVQRAKELGDQFKKIEVSLLRKKVRELTKQMKEERQAKRAYVSNSGRGGRVNGNGSGERQSRR